MSIRILVSAMMNSSLLKRLFAPFSKKYADSVALDRSAAMYKKGAYREAHALLWNVMSHHPEWRNGDLYVLCANLELIVNDDVSRASELLDTASRLGCTDMATYYCVSGYVFMRAGDRERGLREMERAVELGGGVHHLSELGRKLSWSGDPRAEYLWKQVLQQEPSNCLAYANLGILAAKTGDHEKALQMARRAEELHPSAFGFQEIARLYAAIGEYQTALDKYMQADRLGQELTAATCADIVACHFELGNTREGRRWLQKGRRQFPDSQWMKEAWETYGEQCNDGQADETQGA